MLMIIITNHSWLIVTGPSGPKDIEAFGLTNRSIRSRPTSQHSSNRVGSLCHSIKYLRSPHNMEPSSSHNERKRCRSTCTPTIVEHGITCRAHISSDTYVVLRTLGVRINIIIFCINSWSMIMSVKHVYDKCSVCSYTHLWCMCGK